MSNRPDLKQQIYEIVEADSGENIKSRIFDIFLSVLILANVLAIILESVEPYRSNYTGHFHAFEIMSVTIFTLEYVCRIWLADRHPALSGYSPGKARMAYVFTPYAIIDLLAIAPFYLSFLLPVDLRMLRVFRLLRFLKIARYSPALSTIYRVVKAEKRALLGTLIIMFSILLLSSTLAYIAEHEAQPDKFGSIPKAMWWALATLTTVGYGDVIPATVTGKIIGGFVMLFGLGMFALPIGIIATGFAQEIHRRDFVVNWSMVGKVKLFSKLSAPTILSVSQLLQSRSISAGSVIARRGEDAHCMYLVVKGSVSLFFDDQTEPETVHDGGHFGELALLKRSQRTATIIADTDCQLLILDAADFHRLLKTNDELRQQIESLSHERYKNLFQHPDSGSEHALEEA